MRPVLYFKNRTHSSTYTLSFTFARNFCLFCPRHAQAPYPQHCTLPNPLSHVFTFFEIFDQFNDAYDRHRQLSNNMRTRSHPAVRGRSHDRRGIGTVWLMLNSVSQELRLGFDNLTLDRSSALLREISVFNIEEDLYLVHCGLINYNQLWVSLLVPKQLQYKNTVKIHSKNSESLQLARTDIIRNCLVLRMGCSTVGQQSSAFSFSV